MLKKLDKYIIKNFLGTYVFMVLLLMSISIVFDVSEKLDAFLGNNLSLKEVIFDYYIYFFILYSSMFSSLIVFISAIWMTSQLAARTEIIAILSGGVSFNRFLRPYFIAATILTAYSLGMNHFVVPLANKKRSEFENRYTAYGETFRNKFVEVIPGTIVYYDTYNIKSIQSTNIWIEKFSTDDNGNKKLIFNLQARKATGDSLTNKWEFTNYFIREIKDDRELIKKGKTLDTVLDFPSMELGQRETIAMALNTEELNKFRKKELKKGALVTYLDLERYQRSSLPFATYILTLIAVSVSCRKTRGGVGANIAMGLAVSMLYIFFQRIMSVYATNAGLDPLIAVWIPNMIFMIVGLYFYKKAPK